MKHFSAGLRRSILHGSGLPTSWQCRNVEYAAQRADAPISGQASTACAGVCHDTVPSEMAALVEAALHAAHAGATAHQHAGRAAAEAGPEPGSQGMAAQRPQRLACAPSEAGSPGGDGQDEEEEGSLLAFVAALDFDRFARELERSGGQASLPKGLPASSCKKTQSACNAWYVLFASQAMRCVCHAQA